MRVLPGLIPINPNGLLNRLYGRCWWFQLPIPLLCGDGMAHRIVKDDHPIQVCFDHRLFQWASTFDIKRDIASSKTLLRLHDVGFRLTKLLSVTGGVGCRLFWCTRIVPWSLFLRSHDTRESILLKPQKRWILPTPVALLDGRKFVSVFPVRHIQWDT